MDLAQLDTRAFIEAESAKELLLIRLLDVNNTALSSGQRAYFSGISERYRVVTGLSFDMGFSSMSNFNGSGLTAIGYGSARHFGVTLVNRNGRAVLENLPIGAIWSETNVAVPGYNRNGQVFRCWVDCDLQSSYITYYGTLPALTASLLLPLTVSFKS